MSGSRAIITLWASLIAWIMFIVGHQRVPRSELACVALLGDVPRHVGVDVLEHAADIVLALLRQDAELLGFLLRGADGRVDLRRRAAWRSSSHSPSAIRCAFSRSIGSPSGHALASLVGR